MEQGNQIARTFTTTIRTCTQKEQPPIRQDKEWMLAERHETEAVNPHAQFVAELRKLHLFAGEPSTRDLARRADRELKVRVSHKTVDNALNGERLPRWNIALIVVKLLRGNERYFQTLWLSAKAHISGEPISHLSVGEEPEPGSLDGIDWSGRAPGSGPGWSTKDRATADRGAPGWSATDDPDAIDAAEDSDQDDAPSGAPTTGALTRRAPWLSDLAGVDDPAVILVIKAAFRDGVDVNQLVLDIVAHDPGSAGPALAAIAANALPKAAEIVRHLAARDPSRATQLLAAVAASDPADAAALLRLLLDERAIEPLTVSVVAIRLCRADPGHRGLAKEVITAVADAGQADQLASRLADFLQANPSELAVSAGVLQETLFDPASQRAGCQLLTWLAKVDRMLAAELFVLAIADFARGRSRRDHDNRTLLGVIAGHYPRICATLVLTYALREGLAALSEDEAALLGRLVLELAAEDLPMAAELACAMAVNRRKTVMRLLAQTKDIKPTGQLLVEMAARDPKLPAGILVDWISSPFPSVPVPPGRVLRPMANLDPSATIRILATMADLTDGAASAGKGFFITGLDRRELYELANVLRPHANPQEWQLIRPLLRLGRYRG